MKKTFTLLCFLLFCLEVASQTVWMQHPTNPIVPASLDPNSMNIYTPRIIHDGTNYHMWYTRRRGNKESIGYIRSMDGINWTLIDSAVLRASGIPGRFDMTNVGHPSVILDNGVFKMWYWGQGPNTGNIGYATSPDGRVWTRVNGSGMNFSVYDKAMDANNSVGLSAPYVIKDGATYKMWYARGYYKNGGHAHRIAYATSPDGINWTYVPSPAATGAVVDIGTAGTFDENFVNYPTVLKANNQYYMWYNGFDNGSVSRVGYARSIDGITWTKISGTAAKGSVMENATSHTVLYSAPGFKMWYPGTTPKTINYATSGLALDVSENDALQSALQQNYPNPFSRETNIRYAVKNAAQIVIKVYDLQGKEVSEILNKHHAPGDYSIKLDGSKLANGLYYYQLLNGEEMVSSRKMVVLK